MSEKSWKFDNEAHQSKDAFKAKGKMWLWPALVGIAVDDGEMVSAVAHDMGWLFLLCRDESLTKTFPQLLRKSTKRGRVRHRERLERKIERLAPKRGHRYPKACRELLIIILLSCFVSHLKAEPLVDPTHARAAYEEAAQIYHCSYSFLRKQWNVIEERGCIKIWDRPLIETDSRAANGCLLWSSSQRWRRLHQQLGR